MSKYLPVKANTVPVGAWLASEEAREIAKSFAGKTCSYKLRSVFNIPFS